MNDTKKDSLPSFDSLDFEPHANVPNAVQAKLDLGNGFEISVVSMKDKEYSFGGLYGNASKGTYEVAMFQNGSMLPLARYDDVVGWQTATDITKLMHEAVKNGNAWADLLHEIRSESHADLLS